MVKLNVLLARVEQTASSYAKMLKDYFAFFKGEQGQFVGTHKTHIPREGYFEDPSKIANIQVVTTVGEKLEWLEEQAGPHMKALLDIDNTNASSGKRVELKVGDVSFGNLSAAELMRLKAILSNPDLERMYAVIPVRSDRELWKPTTAEQYVGREIYETEMVRGVTKTTEKTAYILDDPNIGRLKDQSSYKPVTAMRDRMVETGDYTSQNFSGEWTQRQKAELLKRRSALLTAVVEALKVVNDTQVIESSFNVDTFFRYMHGK